MVADQVTSQEAYFRQQQRKQNSLSARQKAQALKQFLQAERSRLGIGKSNKKGSKQYEQTAKARAGESDMLDVYSVGAKTWLPAIVEAIEDNGKVLVLRYKNPKTGDTKQKKIP